MSELLIRVTDKTNPDPYLDVGCCKRGDVIAVCEDGHQWGSQELTAPYWRILKLPGIPVATAQNFLASQVDLSPTDKSRMLLKRAISLDLANAAFSTPVKAWIADDSRVEPSRTVNITTLQFTNLKVVKARLADPNTL
jgi:hypothetical protein